MILVAAVFFGLLLIGMPVGYVLGIAGIVGNVFPVDAQAAAIGFLQVDVTVFDILRSPGDRAAGTDWAAVSQ